MTARHASIGLLSLIHAVACFDLWMTFSSGTLLPQSDGLTLILSVVLQAGSALYLTVQVRGNRLPAFNLTRFARAGGYALLVSLLGGSMLVSAGWLGRPVARVFFFTALAGTASVGYVLSAGIVTFPWRRLLDILVANVVIGTLLLEVGLLTISRVYPSRIFFDPTSAASMIDVWRVKPHSTGFGFRYSSLGYHDHEFFAADADDLVIALLADSFGVGIVPYEYNFATVAENRLKASLSDRFDRIGVHNFGIPATGMREYLHLLEQEALAYNPSKIVLCVFVGNDIDGIRRPSRRDRYLIQDWLFSTYISRAYSVYSNLRAEGKSLVDLADYLGMKGLGGAVAVEDTPQAAVSETHPEYLKDWTKEPPHLDRETFLRWESRRLPVCDTTSVEIESRYRDFFEALARANTLTTSRLLVLVIPDQFQIEDDLWNELLRDVDHPGRFDRFYPQTRIARFCEQQGIAYLDTLPLLSKHQKQGRTYHLQDTHWNARGNRIAGEALADRLVQDLE